MLAAVGTVVGTFIASTLNDTFDATPFEISMAVYGAYVVVFPGIIGLWSVWQRSGDIHRAFEARRSQLIVVLHKTKVDNIVGTRTDRARKRLRAWIIVFGLVYATLGTAAIYAAQIVPDLAQPR